jgi:hypothetical protein
MAYALRAIVDAIATNFHQQQYPVSLIAAFEAGHTITAVGQQYLA